MRSCGSASWSSSPPEELAALAKAGKERARALAERATQQVHGEHAKPPEHDYDRGAFFDREQHQLVRRQEEVGLALERLAPVYARAQQAELDDGVLEALGKLQSFAPDALLEPTALVVADSAIKVVVHWLEGLGEDGEALGAAREVAALLRGVVTKAKDVGVVAKATRKRKAETTEPADEPESDEPPARTQPVPKRKLPQTAAQPDAKRAKPASQPAVQIPTVRKALKPGQTRPTATVIRPKGWTSSIFSADKPVSDPQRTPLNQPVKKPSDPVKPPVATSTKSTEKRPTRKKLSTAEKRAQAAANRDDTLRWALYGEMVDTLVKHSDGGLPPAFLHELMMVAIDFVVKVREKAPAKAKAKAYANNIGKAFRITQDTANADGLVLRGFLDGATLPELESQRLQLDAEHARGSEIVAVFDEFDAAVTKLAQKLDRERGGAFIAAMAAQRSAFAAALTLAQPQDHRTLMLALVEQLGAKFGALRGGAGSLRQVTESLRATVERCFPADGVVEAPPTGAKGERPDARTMIEDVRALARDERELSGRVGEQRSPFASSQQLLLDPPIRSEEAFTQWLLQPAPQMLSDREIGKLGDQLRARAADLERRVRACAIDDTQRFLASELRRIRGSLDRHAPPWQPGVADLAEDVSALDRDAQGVIDQGAAATREAILELLQRIRVLQGRLAGAPGNTATRDKLLADLSRRRETLRALLAKVGPAKPGATAQRTNQQGVLTAFHTAGGGDCGFHAVLGEPDPETGAVRTTDIRDKRLALAKQIRELGVTDAYADLLTELLATILDKLEQNVALHDDELTLWAQVLARQSDFFAVAQNLLHAAKIQQLASQLMRGLLVSGFVQHLQHLPRGSATAEWLVRCVLSSELERDQVLRAQLISVDDEQRVAVLCTSDPVLLGKLVDENLDALCDLSREHGLNLHIHQAAYLQMRAEARPVVREIVDQYGDLLLTAYAAAVETPGFYLHDPDLALLAQLHGRGLTLFAHDPSAEGGFTRMPGAPGANPAVVYHRGAHYERATFTPHDGQ